MHAYGHQWSCQLIYNPRLRIGLGLSDGEGTERLWSRLRKLIGITRNSSVRPLCSRYLGNNTDNMIQRSRRLWLIDGHARSIGVELRDDLGDWLVRKMRKGVEAQGAEAKKQLSQCGIDGAILRQQWALQKSSQLSVRSRAYIFHISNGHELTVMQMLRLDSKKSLIPY